MNELTVIFQNFQFREWVGKKTSARKRNMVKGRVKVSHLFVCFIRVNVFFVMLNVFFDIYLLLCVFFKKNLFSVNLLIK